MSEAAEALYLVMTTTNFIEPDNMCRSGFMCNATRHVCNSCPYTSYCRFNNPSVFIEVCENYFPEFLI